MNVRERFLSLFSFQACPRTPRWEMGYWAGAVQRWYEEGLPGIQQELRFLEPYSEWVNGPAQPAGYLKRAVRDKDVSAYFDLDKGAVAVALNSTVAPPFYEGVLEETDQYVIKKRPDGVISKELKKAKIPFENQVRIDIYYKGEKLDKQYQADFIPHINYVRD